MTEINRGGAPKGNTNAVKHGGRSPRWGVVLAKLGPRFAPAYFDVCRLRKHVERLVTKRLGRLTLRERCKIQTLCRLEMSCRAAEMAIRDNPKMTSEELRATRTMIVQWSIQRDRALAELLGDAPAAHQSPWDVLDAMQAAARRPRPEDPDLSPEPPASGSGAEEN